MEGDTINILKKSVVNVKGVGEARAALLNKLGIFTVEDLITYYPRDYEDRSQIKKIRDLEDGEVAGFEGVVASTVQQSRPRRGMTIQKMMIKDGNGTITAIWFNQSYLKNVFSIGDRYVFFGKIRKNFNTITVQNPVYEKVNSGNMKNVCKIVPIYWSTAKLTQNILRSIIQAALEMAVDELTDPIPKWIREKYNLCHIQYAVQNIHYPKSNEDFKLARHRLVFEELLKLQLGLYYIKNKLNAGKGIEFSKNVDIDEFCKKLPFKLTNAQEKVLNEVIEDMESPKIMNRLIQGDVGSGKTVIAMLALYKAVKSIINQRWFFACIL
jgi:ATP-dependent DNA helicase RecG